MNTEQLTAKVFFDKNIRADKEYILPAWAEEFAEKYAQAKVIEATKGYVPEKMDALWKGVETLLSALRDVIKQIPNDERLADYRLDFAEHAESLALELLESSKIK